MLCRQVSILSNAVIIHELKSSYRCRLHALRYVRSRLLTVDDLQGGSDTRHKNALSIPINLLPYRQYICHGDQRARRRPQAYLRWQQSTHPLTHIHIRHRDCRVHSDPDELFQQGIGYLFDERVGGQSCKQKDL